MAKRVKVYKRADELARRLELFRRRAYDGNALALFNLAMLLGEVKHLVLREAEAAKQAEDKRFAARQQRSSPPRKKKR